jgi:hypothetical protein
MPDIPPTPIQTRLHAMLDYMVGRGDARHPPPLPSMLDYMLSFKKKDLCFPIFLRLYYIIFLSVNFFLFFKKKI